MPVAVTSSCVLSRSKTRRDSGWSPAVTSSPVRQQMFSTPCSAAVKTNRPPAIASSSFDMPTWWRLLVALGQEVAPGGRPPEPVVHGRAQVVDLFGPRQLARPLDRLQPHAAHLRDHLAATVGP